MTFPGDIWQAAGALVARFAQDAPLYALQSADQLIERGDLAAAARWQQVRQATIELLLVRDRAT